MVANARRQRVAPSAWQVGAFLGALLPAIVTLRHDAWAPHSDFSAFYQTALAFRLDEPAAKLVTALPSLSPPTLALVMSPLTWLPINAAFLVWTAINILLVADAGRRLRSRLLLSDRAIVWFMIASLGAVSALQIWSHGQLGWIVGYVFTRAWLSSSKQRAGLWLSIGIALKPPLALTALLLPAGIWTVAGLASAGISLAGVMLTGLAPWQDWFRLHRLVSWLDAPTNLSWFGVVARIQGGHPTVHQLSGLAWGTLMTVCVLVIAATLRANGTHRWALAGLSGILISPLGWVHYLPSVVAPLITVWPGSGLMRLAIILLCVPVLVVQALLQSGQPQLRALGTWVYPCGGLALWGAVMWSANRLDRAERPTGDEQ